MLHFIAPFLEEKEKDRQTSIESGAENLPLQLDKKTQEAIAKQLAEVGSNGAPTNLDALKEFQLMVIQDGKFIPLEQKTESMNSNKIMVQQSETEFSVTPEKITTGEVSLSIQNKGRTTIATAVEGPGLDTVYDTQGQQTKTVKIKITKGTYTFFDPIGDHKEKGMMGSVTVE